jgi:5-methyltetrahydropteroyltriglutamate--homocysteine methyltransferase
MPTPEKPTYRAEVVGSLLQPQNLLDARVARTADKITAEELREIENAAVLHAIAVQEEAGLDVLADGEMHRTGWAGARFYLDGFTYIEGARSSYPANVGQRQMDGGGFAATQQMPEFRFSAVTEKITPIKNGFLGEEFPFLRAHTERPAKYTTAAPSYYRRYWSDQVSKGAAYQTCEQYLEDVRDWLHGVAEWLVAEGCDYIQLDAPNYGSLCDPENLAWHKGEGHDTDAELQFDGALDSSVFDGLNVTSALHVCRGNGGNGAFHSVGGYAAIAGQLFPHLTVDVALLEYDSDRAGDFGPLQQIRSDTVAVLGLLTTKEATVEDRGVVEARVREAATVKPLNELALSTQCGFASAANAPMSEDDERAKLQIVGDLAHQIWF